jgi:DNA (cytosine-5)-methyltransferase 1
MKVLNLYAGIGGNRKLWTDVEVTAVELNPQIAKIYQDFFPQDKVIVGDAHQYLLEHFKEFEFIWSSPPCQSHSGCNNFLHPQGIIRYPDMSLWQEIIFLKKWFKNKWVVENVKTYYEPLIKPFWIGRHYIWANFLIRQIPQPKNEIKKMHNMGGKREQAHNKSQIEHNCVNAHLGLHILNESKREVYQDLFK